MSQDVAEARGSIYKRSAQQTDVELCAIHPEPVLNDVFYKPVELGKHVSILMDVNLIKEILNLCIYLKRKKLT